VQEDDDQLGMAHFLEHMAFNGTEKYDKQAIIDYLESVGMRFAADINAATTFEKTVYKLKVPTDEEGAVSKGFDVLHQWATAIKLDPAEVIAERGVVLEEWRASRGSSMRLAEELLPITLAGSPYPERLPIGKPEFIEGATPELLERYYRDWYRPDLMAVVAVGDFDAAAVESEIKAVFSGLVNPDSSRPRTDAVVPLPREYRAATIRDPEVSDLAATVIALRAKTVERDYGQMRQSLSEIVGLLALGKRVADMGEDPDSPFVTAGAAPTEAPIEAIDAIGYAAQAKDGRTVEALESLLTEMRRAELHGFDEEEVEKIRLQVKMMIQMVAARFEGTDGAEHADSLVDTFVLGDVFSGPELMQEVVDGEVDQLSAEAVTSAYAELHRKLSPVVVVLGPEGSTLPDESELREMANRIGSSVVAPWGRSASIRPLMETTPTPGSIVGEEQREFGITEWTLSNGARVLVKRTEFKDEEVLFRATSRGGLGLVAEDDHHLGAYVSSIVEASGAGDLDPVAFRDALTGRGVSVSTWMNGIAEYVDGSARTEDLEALMQLVHLRMTGARDDGEAFVRWQQAQVERLEKAEKIPMTQFNRKLNHLLWAGHPRQESLTADMVRAFEHQRALQLYRERFVDNAGDFVFVFTGDFDPEALRPLVATYLASIPGGGAREDVRDGGERMAGADTPLRLGADVEPRSSVNEFFYGNTPWSRELEIQQSLVQEILRLRLREVMREGESGTYGVSVGGFYFEASGEHYLSLFYACDPKRVESLRKTLLAELASLRTQGPSEAELAKVREIWTREHQEAVEENGYWRRVISRAERQGQAIALFHNLQAELAQVNKPTFLAAMKRFVPADRRFEAIADPLELEAPAPKAPAPKAPAPTAPAPTSP